MVLTNVSPLPPVQLCRISRNQSSTTRVWNQSLRRYHRVACALIVDALHDILKTFQWLCIKNGRQNRRHFRQTQTRRRTHIKNERPKPRSHEPTCFLLVLEAAFTLGELIRHHQGYLARRGPQSLQRQSMSSSHPPF